MSTFVNNENADVERKKQLYEASTTKERKQGNKTRKTYLLKFHIKTTNQKQHSTNSIYLLSYLSQIYKSHLSYNYIYLKASSSIIICKNVHSK